MRALAAAATRLIAALALTAAIAAAECAAAYAAGPPQVGSAWTTEVTATSATLHAEVNPEGIFTTYRFEYLTEATYGQNVGEGREGFAGAAQAPPGAEAGLGSATTDQPAQQHLQGLQPSTAYRYRILATSECESGNRCTVEGPIPTFTTEETAPVFVLPDNRDWELVSPVDKNGGAIQGFGANHGGGVLQAASQGSAVTYSSASSFGEGAQGAPPASQYISRRSTSGWATQNITTPTVSGSYGEHPDGVPYQLFSTDLSAGLLLNGEHCRVEGGECPVANPPLPGSEAPPGYQNYYLRDDEDGGFQALITASNAELGLSAKQFDLALAGASPDLSHLVLSTCAALTPEATEVASGGGGCVPAETNLYEWSGGALSLINGPASHHAQLAAQAGAISSDGRRAYFTAGEDSPIFLREEGQPIKFIANTVGGVGSFQTASADGSLAFFTVGGDLYRYDALTEATSEPPLATEVQGVLGASEDGSRVYYLTSAGLFLWQTPGTTTEIAPGPPAAFAGDYPPTTGTARVTPDGAHLAFLSSAELTGYDNTDAAGGEPDSEAYLYTAPAGSGEGTLTCASCNPTGERPVGPSTIPGAIANGKGPTSTDSYKPRNLSVDGARLFFDSSDSLVLQDTNSAPDVYQWEAQGSGSCAKPGGCVNLISSGRSAEGASFVDASADGADAFFLTDGSLVPQDPGSVDLYDAREGGGFPPPPNSIECDGDACQSLPPEPEDPTPGTLVPGSPNPPVHFPKTHHTKPHKKKHHHHKRHRSNKGRIR